VPIVVVDEAPDHHPGFLDRFKAMEIEHLFLKRPVEPFDDPTALRAPDERRRGNQTKKFEFSPKIR